LQNRFTKAQFMPVGSIDLMNLAPTLQSENDGSIVVTA